MDERIIDAVNRAGAPALVVDKKLNILYSYYDDLIFENSEKNVSSFFGKKDTDTILSAFGALIPLPLEHIPPKGYTSLFASLCPYDTDYVIIAAQRIDNSSDAVIEEFIESAENEFNRVYSVAFAASSLAGGKQNDEDERYIAPMKEGIRSSFMIGTNIFNMLSLRFSKRKRCKKQYNLAQLSALLGQKNAKRFEFMKKQFGMCVMSGVTDLDFICVDLEDFISVFENVLLFGCGIENSKKVNVEIDHGFSSTQLTFEIAVQELENFDIENGLFAVSKLFANSASRLYYIDYICRENSWNLKSYAVDGDLRIEIYIPDAQNEGGVLSSDDVALEDKISRYIDIAYAYMLDNCQL
ncbi:MAG: hypothetical protein J5922_01340 [Clostridia bacterium]|nr:hypothetical protein [Clostridia bacterium]